MNSIFFGDVFEFDKTIFKNNSYKSQKKIHTWNKYQFRREYIKSYSISFFYRITYSKFIKYASKLLKHLF